MTLIRAEQLTKRFRLPVRKPGLVGAFQHLFTQKYEEKVAVDQIALQIDTAEAVAYVGPNGAGKSTTIKMLTGILVPSAGEVIVDGRVPFREREANARSIGVVFGQRTQLWWDLPVRESFALVRDIYGIPEPIYRKRLDQFIELLGMADFLDLSVRKISLGQRMRADLAAALLHQPKILYLDEPTIGLDLAVKARIREFIRTLNAEQGTTILLTTHDLGDIEDICRRLVIIDQGRIIYDGSLTQIKQRFARTRTLHIQLRAPAQQLAETVIALPGVTYQPTISELEANIRFDPRQIAIGDLVTLLLAQADIADFRIDEPGIEEIIRQVYEGTLRLNRRFRQQWAFVRIAYKASSAYPSALVMHALAHIVMAIALFYLWQAIIASGDTLNGLVLGDLKVYLLFGLLTNAVMSYHSESRISRKVLDGSIAIDLLRPLDFQWACLSETIGRLGIEGVLAGGVLILVAIFFGGVPFPTDLLNLVYAGLSLILALLIKFGIIYLAGLVCFWTSSSLGITWLRSAITNLFSGAIIPPNLFPGWLAAIAFWLPFQGIVATPAQIYLGHLNGATLIGALALQLGWVVLLWVAGRGLWGRAVWQLEINGG